MRRVFLIIIGLMLLVGALTAQDAQQENQKPLYIHATIYPTFSLSRYDYNNDLNKVELRVYLELRQETRSGKPLEEAKVTVNGHGIPYDKKERDYRNRIEIKNPEWSRTVDLDIKTANGIHVSRRFQFPGWLILEQPKPEIYRENENIAISWRFSHQTFSTTLRVYDFKDGKRIMSKYNLPAKEVAIPFPELPEQTIVRVMVTPDWFFKKFIRGRGIVRGSEINVIPWSQAFFRTLFSTDRKNTDR